MSESTSLSLLVPPEPSSKSPDLQLQIQRIVAQRGHFRHVTERSLHAESQGKFSDLNTGADGIDEAQSDEDEPLLKRQERLWKRREEMIERLR